MRGCARIFECGKGILGFVWACEGLLEHMRVCEDLQERARAC